jgi:hypothetical protein
VIFLWVTLGSSACSLTLIAASTLPEMLQKPGHKHVQADFDECQARLYKQDVFAGFPDRKNVRSPVLDLA